MTIPGGSQQYIDAVMTDFPKDRVHISSPVTSLTNNPSGAVVLKTSDGSTSTYDHVILATHGDQALKILEPSIRQDEEAILSNFQTSKNSAVLHSDLRVSFLVDFCDPSQLILCSSCPFAEKPGQPGTISHRHQAIHLIRCLLLYVLRTI